MKRPRAVFWRVGTMIGTRACSSGGWTASWKKFTQLMPELAEKLERDRPGLGHSSASMIRLQAVWPTIKPQTIDYGIMEKADRVVVIPAVDLGWNDVGSWESMFEVFTPDANGNIILDAEHIGIGYSQFVDCFRSYRPADCDPWAWMT